jgi:putative transcriptional regulator
MTTFSDIKTGRLLIAEPFMIDRHFKRSVVLLTEHTPDGSVGFIINKILDLEPRTIFEEFPDFKVPLYYGGPCHTDSVHFIHNVGDLLDGSVRLSSGVYCGGDWHQLKFLIESKLIEPKHIRFFAGCSGWDEKLLKNEVNEGDWIVSDMHANYLFNVQPTTLWRTILQHKGNAFSIIADMQEDNHSN